jgi:phage terminase small subunit
MPRRSAASMSVIPMAEAGACPAPSEGAPPEVRAIFAEIVRLAPADHFRPSDGPLLEEYAGATALARRAARQLDEQGAVLNGRPNAWIVIQEKSVRAMTALSARLRLSPQHRADSRSAGRRAAGPTLSPYEVDPDDA